MGTFSGKTIFITGGSRGIGKAIGLKMASEGANIVIAAKTALPHPKLEGTIFSAAQEMEQAGGKALAVEMDIRQEEMVDVAIEKAINVFGGIDILINNASAINLSGTASLGMKAFDLMQQINGRGTFMMSQKCLPYLIKSENPHILTLSPPLNMDSKWFAQYPAYTVSKYTMSMFVKGFAEEFKSAGIAVNALWPKTLIATAAIKYLPGGDEMLKRARHPEIVADAAFVILSKKAKENTGNFFVDEEVLKLAGVEDFKKYAVDSGLEPIPDLFL